MSTHLEVSMQRDLDRIRAYVTEMGALAEQALQDAIKALVNGDRQLAYTVILRDLFVDEKEKEIDRLCLEFLVRQQPVARAQAAAQRSAEDVLSFHRPYLALTGRTPLRPPARAKSQVQQKSFA